MRFSICLLVTLYFLVTATSDAVEAGETRIDIIVAVVDTHAITQRELELEVLFGRGDTTSLETRRQTLAGLIERELMLVEAERWGIDLADASLAQERTALVSRSDSEKAFEKMLAEHAVEPEELEQWLHDRWVVQRFIERRWILPLRIEGRLLPGQIAPEVERLQREWLQQQRKDRLIRVLDPDLRSNPTASAPEGS